MTIAVQPVVSDSSPAIAPAASADLHLTFPEFQAQIQQLGVLRRCAANHPGDLAFFCDGGGCRCLVCGRANWS